MLMMVELVSWRCAGLLAGLVPGNAIVLMLLLPLGRLRDLLREGKLFLAVRVAVFCSPSRDVAAVLRLRNVVDVVDVDDALPLLKALVRPQRNDDEVVRGGDLN